ncbi:LysR family transcriptional regulator [Fictibacillus enclensis]|uniref:LysR family transcriptional regulator n=1 Tax=Fictibacillus enclensis TaxID=1017270 RepID=UPI0025A258B7|nr:LysR family transcriptional regulator [Fictibacillus enclensis]MDM5201539.1 LysR family transcriptional regulator [Fictibacillus enclensis]
MNEKDWLILRTIHEERNITKAAEKLYISQPSLTYRIQQLEQELNVRILSRRKRGVDFTQEGEYVVQYATDMTHRLNEMKDYLANLQGAIKGTLRLGVSQTFARYRLPGILANFLNDYPEVDIHLKAGFSYQVIQMINKEEANIGIIRDVSDWRGPKLLLDEESICIVSKNKIDIDQLPYLTRINYNTDPSLKSVIDAWWKESFDHPPTITMEVDLIETCREMVLNGLGYAILPAICLEGHETLNTYEMYIHDKKVVRNTWLIFNERSLDLSVVKTFIEFMDKGS